MTKEKWHDPVEVVMRHLDQCAGRLTEAEAARLVDLSPSWFRHRFRRMAGMSFRTARVRAKLERGLLLLTTTHLSIPEITTMLQYSDRTKFEKAFKRAYRLTPTQYRNTTFSS